MEGGLFFLKLGRPFLGRYMKMGQIRTRDGWGVKKGLKKRDIFLDIPPLKQWLVHKFKTWRFPSSGRIHSSTEEEIQVVSPRLIQKHYTNAPRIAMVVQRSEIKCRTQVYWFCAHSLTQCIAMNAMIKKSFKNSENTQKCTKKMPFSMIEQKRPREWAWNL